MADNEVNVEEMIAGEEEGEDGSIPFESLNKMKVAELRKLLKDRGLPCLGSKAALLSRLQKALSPSDTTAEETETIEVEDDAEDEDVEDVSDAENVIAEPQIKEVEVADGTVPEKTATVLKKPTPPANAENIPEKAKSKEAVTNVASEPTTVKDIPVITAPTSETTDATDKTDAVSAKPAVSSDEKLRQRAERFGITSDNDKKAARAARFGTVTTNLSNKPSAKIAPTPITADDIDRLKKRAERFGTVVSSTLTKLEDEDKLRKRKQRFGQITGPTSNPTSATTPTLASTKSIEEVEEKKRKRAERFGLS